MYEKKIYMHKYPSIKVHIIKTSFESDGFVRDGGGGERAAIAYEPTIQFFSGNTVNEEPAHLTITVCVTV